MLIFSLLPDAPESGCDTRVALLEQRCDDDRVGGRTLRVHGPRETNGLREQLVVYGGWR